MPEPSAHDAAARRRQRIRAWRAAHPHPLAILDDDPTGSQSVHSVEVVTVLERDELAAAFREPASVAFLLTNTRGLPESRAAELTEAVARDLLELDPLTEFVSRSDSTLRGHVLAEIEAIGARRRAATGAGFDAVLLAPAFFEAGRFTQDDVHYATLAGVPAPVGETEFAKDATFGYRSSNLRDFLAEKSGGRIDATDVLSISLETIRRGGPDAVRDLLLGAPSGSFIVVNGTEYSDFETVVLGVQAAVDAGRTFLFRTGPSFVRALAGIEPRAPLGADAIGHLAGGTGHGLVVVGSHVSQTSRQVAAARERGGLHEVELSVPRVVAGDRAYLRERADAVRAALADRDVLLFTSRELVTGADAGTSLDIAVAVSAAVSGVVADALAARPAWVVAKGGITSHDVAVHGLGIRRARVLGQMLPGQVSVFEPLAAREGAVGIPFVVFAGNVGDDETLADVVQTLHSAQLVAR
ncbi:four-carbon acid sugar kinase family protein [Naasia aerilata]|uniref:Four-carbon acid sugar kinase family protein n=1 Tax=Naasia aerilata TaxID=1162966 RepID=A0ABM8GBB2_9MICO|nr:four-carbon acid sugar kinase family protein [Naasia aerilata]BDZ45513.1 hypothetical protein GCM10025866_14220 [Naasia aerilata]